MRPEVEEVQNPPEALAGTGSNDLADPLDTYARREAEALTSADFWRARFDILANQRMSVTLALATVGVGYLTVPGIRMLLVAVALILSVIFMVLVVKHAGVRRQEVLSLIHI